MDLKKSRDPFISLDSVKNVGHQFKFIKNLKINEMKF